MVVKNLDMFVGTSSFENLLAHTHFTCLWTSANESSGKSILDVIKMQRNLLDDEVSFWELSELQEWPSSSFCRTVQACPQNTSFYPGLPFLCTACGATYLQIRKHSSRMRTARSMGCLPNPGCRPPGHVTCDACWESNLSPTGQNDRCLWKYYLAPNYVCGR